MFGRRYGGYGDVGVRRMNFMIFFAYLVLGVYFINVPLNFLQVPEVVTQFNNWIVFVGGIFMFLGAISYFKSKRMPI